MEEDDLLSRCKERTKLAKKMYKPHREKCEKLYNLGQSKRIVRAQFKDGKSLWRMIKPFQEKVDSGLRADRIATHFSGVNNPTDMTRSIPADS